MKKGLLVLLLSVFSLNSCIRALLPHDKKYPPAGGKVWYSQNEKEDYPNIEILADFNEKIEQVGNSTFVGHILYKSEKKQVGVVVYFSSGFSIGLKNFGEITSSDKTLYIPYVYRYKENYIELKKVTEYPFETINRFGFSFNDYLPFNLYIKDFNEDEWYTKYPEDKIE